MTHAYIDALPAVRSAVVRPNSLRSTSVLALLRGCRKLPRQTNARFKDKHPHLAYEAEALGQETLEELLRARLDALLPVPLNRTRARERRQSAEIARLLRGAHRDLAEPERARRSSRTQPRPGAKVEP